MHEEKEKYLLKLKENQNETLINCFPLFDIEILSQSLSNQYDQLALKFNPTLLNDYNNIKNEYKLILYSINLNLINKINLNVKIEKTLKKPKFYLNEYEFIIKISSYLKKGTILGFVNAKSNDQYKNIFYKINNKTNFIEINSLTGQLFVSNDILNFNFNNEINLLVEASYSNYNENENENENLKSFTNVKILFRFINYINNIILDIDISSSFIYQYNNTYYININNNTNNLLNEILFKFKIKSNYYPNDKYLLLLENSHSMFSLLSPPSSPSSSPLQNNYILKTMNYVNLNSIYLLKFKIKHELTQTFVAKNVTLKLKIVNENLTNMNQFSLLNICLENLTYFIYDNNNNENHIGKLKVIQTNSNVSNFTNFFISRNQNQFIINRCELSIEQLNSFYLNQTQFYLCSTLINQTCFNITLIDLQSSSSSSFSSLFKNKNFLLSKSFLFSKTIEITFFIFIIIFILATITLLLIICRLKGFHLCLTIKNYLFYGKKYGIHNAQRLSSTKLNVKIVFFIYKNK